MGEQQVSADYCARAVLDEQQRTAEVTKLAQDRQIEINVWRGRHDEAEARIRDLEGALREICDSWDNPPPAARMDVRYQDAVRLARAALEADRPAGEEG